MHDLIPLTQTASGCVAQVVQLLGTADVIHRLEEMGLRHGVTIEVLQAGRPCIVRLNGHKLCFRDAEALGVLVRVGDDR